MTSESAEMLEGITIEQVEEDILKQYRQLIAQKYPDAIETWPLISGYNFRLGQYDGKLIIFFDHTGNPGMIGMADVAIPRAAVGHDTVTKENLPSVRANLERYFRAEASDAVVILVPGETIDDELLSMLQRHEAALGLSPMKVFLSHKGTDKPSIREVKKTLEFLGFQPWFDEDAMNAGVELERALLQGFKDSCAAVFFVTKHYRDEGFLGTEVNYAIAEKRSKGAKFSIVTIVENGGVVPDLLRSYVWKQPTNQLEALREIIRALPIAVGRVHWK